MATLASDVLRVYESGVEPVWNDVPVIASDIIYAGAAVGHSGATGDGRPLVADDVFLGFADSQVDNSSGSAGDKNVRVRARGLAKLSVVGVTAKTDLDKPVYASDDATFTLTQGSNSYVGKIVRYISSTNCIVQFEADTLVRKVAADADLGDTTGGTAVASVIDGTGTYSQTIFNDNFASVAADLNDLKAKMRTAGVLDE